MPINWPPTGIPSWPPPELETDWFSTSDLRTLILELQERGFTQRAPTVQERNAFFRDARCDDGHQVTGRMLVSPSNIAYPFAVCNNATDRELLVLWPPYSAGWRSGIEA